MADRHLRGTCQRMPDQRLAVDAGADPDAPQVRFLEQRAKRALRGEAAEEEGLFFRRKLERREPFLLIAGKEIRRRRRVGGGEENRLLQFAMPQDESLHAVV